MTGKLNPTNWPVGACKKKRVLCGSDEGTVVCGGVQGRRRGAKRPRPTRSRGAAKSRQRRRGGALMLSELACDAGAFEAKSHPQSRHCKKPAAAAGLGAATTRTPLWRGNRGGQEGDLKRP
jgi:hypothetical protein